MLYTYQDHLTNQTKYLEKCSTTANKTTPQSKDGPYTPVEAVKDLLTFGNVCNLLEEVIEEGKKGQSKFVNIH